MSKPAQPLMVKPRKTFPLMFMAIFFAVAIPIIWPISLFMLFFLAVISLLFTGFFVDTYSGYLKLDEGLLSRKSLLSNKTIKISDIREISTSGAGVFPTSGLGAGAIDLGNAKDGYVSINAKAFKRGELMPLIERLYSNLKSVNPKRAKDLQKAFAQYL